MRVSSGGPVRHFRRDGGCLNESPLGRRGIVSTKGVVAIRPAFGPGKRNSGEPTTDKRYRYTVRTGSPEIPSESRSIFPR